MIVRLWHASARWNQELEDDQVARALRLVQQEAKLKGTDADQGRIISRRHVHLHSNEVRQG